MKYERISTWRSKVVGSLVILLGVAVAARAAWELLRPLLPVIIVLLCLIFIYWLVIARRR